MWRKLLAAWIATSECFSSIWIIRNGENGLLVEVDDATGASEAVLQIYRDRSLKDKLVSKGVEDVHNRFDAQRVSEEHGILFENMWKVETI